MNRRLSALAFAGLLAAQVFPSASVALRQTQRLHEGRPALLSVETRDPRDLFRGEYSVLAYGIGRLSGVEADPALVPANCDIAKRERGCTVGSTTLHVVLEPDAEGVHRAVRVLPAPPTDGSLFVTGKGSYGNLVPRGGPVGGRGNTSAGAAATCERDICYVGTASYGIETWYGEQGRPARLDAMARDTMKVRVLIDAQGTPVLDELLVKGETFSRTARLWD
jgi:uncharacterized membrane-anchored protein